MARPLRIQYPGAFYHITSRGNERKPIFRGKEDRKKFLSYLESANKRYGAIVHAYCLMSNHYHLLLETQEANLSEILHHVNTGYTIYFNKQYNRSGHLLQGRYKAILVEKDAYAAELSRYVHLNPARAAIREKLEDPLFSSLYAYLSGKQSPPWLKTEFVLSYFGKTKRVRLKRYQAFIREGLEKKLESPLSAAVALTALGSQDFITWVTKALVGQKESRDLPALRKLRFKPTIYQIKEEAEKILGKGSKESRKVALYLAHRHSGKQLLEIAKAFGDIGPSAVSQNTKRVNERRLENKHLDGAIRRVERMIMK